MKNHKLTNVEECKVYYETLKKGTYFGRLGKTFSTEANDYFYDTGTGKIARLKKEVFLILTELLVNEDFERIKSLDLSDEQILDAFNDIRSGVESERILSALPAENFVANGIHHLRESLVTQMQNVILEVTQKCNLRCKYCIYHPDHPSFREFGHKHMTYDVAKRSIDMLHQNSPLQDTVYVGFYGGEPLLNFDLIRHVVEYSDQILKGKTIYYSMTTNATLITEELAAYLVEHNFLLTLSLDGPQKYHDENRIYINGKGSYADAERGIKYLLQAYEEQEKEKNLLFNVVTGGPDYDEKYSEIEEFFKNTEWMPDNVSILTNTVDTGVEEHEYVRSNSPEEQEYFRGIQEPLMEWVKKNKSPGGKVGLFADGTVEKELLLIHNRALTKGPAEEYGMHGCCTPGHRRVYVTVDGELYPCEKMGNVPSLGDVWSGFDFKKIKQHYCQASKYSSTRPQVCGKL